MDTKQETVDRLMFLNYHFSNHNFCIKFKHAEKVIKAIVRPNVNKVECSRTNADKQTHAFQGLKKK